MSLAFAPCGSAAQQPKLGARQILDVVRLAVLREADLQLHEASLVPIRLDGGNQLFAAKGDWKCGVQVHVAAGSAGGGGAAGSPKMSRALPGSFASITCRQRMSFASSSMTCSAA